MTILGILRLKLRVDTNFKAQIKSRHLQNASKLRLDTNFKAQNPKKGPFERSNLIFSNF